MIIGQFKKLLYPFLLLSFVVFLTLNWVLPKEIGGWLSCIGYTSVVMTVIGLVYNSFLWRFNPWERTPRLAKRYDATIKYCYKGNLGEKVATVSIEQTLLSVSVEIETDKIKSRTVCSSLVSENEQFILYYTYDTEPRGVGNDDNPKARGTCRIPIEPRNLIFVKAQETLKGTYWTTRKTTGDIVLEENKEKSK